ncbi:MAG: thioredoxin family protein [Lentisphaerota bacterium]
MKFTDKEYTFIYYSSNASEECRKFTPELIKFYGENKKSASIEIIFVSLDKTEKEMTEQIKAMSIPFPIVDFKEIAKSGITKFAGQELPSLILLDKEGNVIADCYEGKKYMGPGKVLDKFKEIMSNVGYD